jgi:general stress protein YciG
MSGTRPGGFKARDTNKNLYGEDYFSRIGRLGGRKSRGGGFTNDRELARRAGALGGSMSRRGKKLTPTEKKEVRKQFEYLYKQSEENLTNLTAKYGQKRPW